MQLNQLELRIRDLVSKVRDLDSKNNYLQDELALSRQDYAAQAQKLEEVKTQIKTLSAATSNNKDEQLGKLQFQEQQIQLLERERLNLRDQIAFLQNTMQNKEKDWQEKLDDVNNNQIQQYEEDQAIIAKLQGQLQETQEQIAQLRLQLEDSKQQAQNAQAEWDILSGSLNEQVIELKKQLSETQQQLDDSHNQTKQLQQDLQDAQESFAAKEKELTTHAVAEQNKLQNQLQEALAAFSEKEKELLDNAAKEQDKLNTQLAQETERFRTEFALQTQKYEQSLLELNQVLTQQKEHWTNEKSELQEQILNLNRQNQEYRSLLLQSADDIRALLARLPVLDAKEPIVAHDEVVNQIIIEGENA